MLSRMHGHLWVRIPNVFCLMLETNCLTEFPKGRNYITYIAGLIFFLIHWTEENFLKGKRECTIKCSNTLQHLDADLICVPDIEISGVLSTDSCWNTWLQPRHIQKIPGVLLARCCVNRSQEVWAQLLVLPEILH